MPIAITEVDEYTATVTVPEPGDDRKAISVEVPFQALGNRSLNAKNRIEALEGTVGEIEDGTYPYPAGIAIDNDDLEVGGTIRITNPLGDYLINPARTYTKLLPLTGHGVGADFVPATDGSTAVEAQGSGSAIYYVQEFTIPLDSDLAQVRAGVQNGASAVGAAGLDVYCNTVDLNPSGGFGHSRVPVGVPATSAAGPGSFALTTGAIASASQSADRVFVAVIELPGTGGVAFTVHWIEIEVTLAIVGRP